MIKQFFGYFKVINNFIVPLEIILYIDDNTRLHYFKIEYISTARPSKAMQKQ